MPEWWVCVPGELDDEQLAELHAVDIPADDVRKILGRGDDGNWETLRTCFLVWEEDEQHARALVAEVLSVPEDHLNAYSGDLLR